MAVSPFQTPGAEQSRLSTAAAHQLKVRHIQRIITPTIAYNMADLADYNPRLDAGVVSGLSMAGVTPDDPVMDMVSERAQYIEHEDTKYGKDGGVFGEWVWNPLKGVIRGAFMGLEGLMQEAESAFVRTPVGMAQGMGLGDAWGESGRSDAFYALQAASEGKRVHAGTGFFAQDQQQDDVYVQEQLKTGRSLADVMAGQEYGEQFGEYGVDPAQMGEAQRSRMQITHGPTQKQTPVSLGRLAAIQVAEPGTRPFQMMSGVVDAGKQIFLDPADIALGGLGKARKLRKFLYSAEELADPTMASKAMQSLAGGMINGGARKTILARTVDDWLTEPQGRGFVNWIQSQEGAEGATAIYDVLGKNNKAAVNPALARELANATELDDVQAILRNAYTHGNMRAVPKEPGGAKEWIKNNVGTTSLGTYLGRMSSVTNSKVLDIHDPNTALANLDVYIANLGLSAEKRQDLLWRAMQINPDDAKYAGELGDQDLYSQYFQLVKDATNNWIDDLGVAPDDPMRQAMAKVFDSPDVHRSFWVDNMGNDVLFGGARVNVMVDGKVTAMPSAVLFSQFLNQGIPLMDSKKIRSMMRRDWFAGGFVPGKGEESGKAKSWLIDTFGQDDFDKVGSNAVVNALDWGMSNLWKPSVLLRVAWPVRVIGEEQLRLGGKMMAGMFNHPLQYMALMATKDSKVLKRVARMTDDVFQEEFLDDASYEATMSSANANIAEAITGKKAGRSGQGIMYEAKPVSEMTDQEWSQAYVFELNQLVKDDVAVQVAGAAHGKYMETGELDASMLDDIKERFFGGDLDHLRQRLLNDTSRFDLLTNRAFADGYIDTVYAKLTHMGGGQGAMLDPYSLKWHDFNGVEMTAGQMRKRMGLTVDQRAELSELYMDTDPIDMFPQLDVELTNRYGLDEGNRILEEVMDVFDEGMARHQSPTQAMDEAMERVDEMAAEVEEATGMYGMPEFENIPTLEAQTGLGEVPRQSFMDMYQTIKADELTQKTIRDELTATEMAAYDKGIHQIGDEILRPADEFAGIEGINVQLATEQADTGGYKTYARWENGRPVAVINTIVNEEGAVVGVLFVGGETGSARKGLKSLADELLDSGEIDLEQLFSFTNGKVPFNEFLRNNGVDVSGMSRAEIWQFLDEHPAIFDDFKAGEWRNPRADYDLNQMQPPTNTRLPGTSTTGSGTRMNYLGTQLAKNESKQWGQHIPYFQAEELGDPRIFELVANGKLADADGKTLLDWGTKRATSNKGVRKQFADRMKYFENDLSWREKSPGFLRKPTATNEAEDIRRWDEAVGGMMQMLMSKPSDKLSRSPAFRQFYWKRASEMAAYLDENDRIRFLDAAAKSNLMQQQDVANKTGQVMRTIRRYTGRENTVDEAMRHINRLAGSPQRTADGAVTSLEQLDQVAKAYAMEETKALLYDLSKSHNITEAMRIIVPFGEAWFEVTSTWMKLMSENPRNIRRLQQGMSGARNNDPFRDTGPDGEQGRGFFFNDPSTGDEVFAYPGMDLIPEWMPFIGGAGEVSENLELVGRASGLNIMAQIMPGLGPVVQIPLSQFGWSDDVDNRALRDIALPFGKSPVEATDPTTWLSPILPTWINKGLMAWGGKGGETNERLYHNTVIDVYKTLLMQGWSDDSPEEMQATLKHAGELAQDITRIRALSNFAAPTAAGNMWEVRYDPRDVEGDVWAYSNLSTAYRQILDENQGDEVQTFKAFQDIFGIDPMLFAVSKTQKVTARAVTIEGKKWEQDNEDLFASEAYPYTAYFGKPDPAEGEFDYETYLDQLNDDIRQPLTPEQWGLKRNQFLGRVAYSNFQRQADRRFQDESQKRLWLSNTYSGLQQLFPGYGQTIVGMPAAPSLDMQVAELNKWVNEPRLAETEAGQALLQYMSYRQDIIRLTQTQFGYTSDTGFRSGKRSAIYRRQLRARGEDLVRENPEFLAMWQQILSRELEEPEATMAPVNIAGVEI